MSVNSEIIQVGNISIFTLSNNSGASVKLSTLGAGILSVNMPDKDGNIDDVVLGYANPLDYMADGPCAGKIPGRYANRICKGHLVIDGNTYQLPINNGPNSLHGGPEGFQNKIWQAGKVDQNSVEFIYHSADGEMGYPGNLEVLAKYTLTDDNTLTLELQATTDAPTVVNLTNHSYWNLAGHNAGKDAALAQLLTIRADEFLATDKTLIPIAKTPVENSPMDFRTPTSIGKRINDDFEPLAIGKGYDHCWVLSENINTAPAVRLQDTNSGRILEIETDMPGVQIYSGNYLDGSPVNKSGRSYNDYDGIAIECQDLPDAPNRPDFPSTLLRPGETYKRHISFKFSVAE